MNLFNYRAFGLTINSEIPLPELVPCPEDGKVIIRLGKVPESLLNPVATGVCFQASPGKFLLRIENVAVYYVDSGNYIQIEPFPGASEDDIRLFLLGSVMGAVLHLNGLFPVHGSSIEVNGKAVIFSGISGSGKSMLAAAFKNNGNKILSDDISAVSFNANQQAIIHPGFPRLKLWHDSLIKLGESLDNLPRVRNQIDKVWLDANDNFSVNPLPLSMIYMLGMLPAENSKIEPLRGVDKFNALKNNTYRVNFIRGFDLMQQHFMLCTKLSGQVIAKSLIRGRNHGTPRLLMEFVQQDMLNTLATI